jgi:hypothetical protein
MRTVITLLVFFFLFGALMAQDNGYIDQQGRLLFKVPYKYANDFGDGLAAVKDVATIDGARVWAYGFIDETGKLLIPLQFYDVREFQHGVCFVQPKAKGKWHLINKQGQKISEEYDKVAYRFYDERCEVCNTNSDGVTHHCGWIDPTGKLVIPMKYVGGSFQEGLVSTCLFNSAVGAYGFLDKDGNEAIPFKFVQAGSADFVNGHARVKIGGKTALIDKQGNVVAPPKFSTVSDFDDKYLVVSVGSGFGPFKYTDWQGNTVIAGPFENAHGFVNDVADVEVKGGKTGIINRKGEFVLNPDFEQISTRFDRYGCMYGKKGDEWFGYNADGTLFGERPIKHLSEMREGKLIPFRDKATEKWGFFNLDGKVRIDPRFEKARGFSANGLALVSTTETPMDVQNLPEGQRPDGHMQTPVQQGDGSVKLFLWKDGYYYPARLIESGKTIHWLEGSRSAYSGEQSKEYYWGVGTPVSCNWLKKGTYYEGNIGEVKDGKIFINYNDGDTEWADPGQCRCKE